MTGKRQSGKRQSSGEWKVSRGIESFTYPLQQHSLPPKANVFSCKRKGGDYGNEMDVAPFQKQTWLKPYEALIYRYFSDPLPEITLCPQLARERNAVGLMLTWLETAQIRDRNFSPLPHSGARHYCKGHEVLCSQWG